jgi:sterol desaturase/sphingolipid hydroxylase (fatty acid hydroxylase superfamily)
VVRLEQTVAQAVLLCRHLFRLQVEERVDILLHLAPQQFSHTPQVRLVDRVVEVLFPEWGQGQEVRHFTIRQPQEAQVRKDTPEERNLLR